MKNNMKRMYAILAATFLAVAALVIFVFIDNANKNKPEDTSISSEAEPSKTATRATKESAEESSATKASMPFTEPYSFQALKVLEVLDVEHESLLKVALYDTERVEEVVSEDLRTFDISRCTDSGKTDDAFRVYSFYRIYVMQDGKFWTGAFKDIEAGDMILHLEDWSKNNYIFVYKQ